MLCARAAVEEGYTLSLKRNDMRTEEGAVVTEEDIATVLFPVRTVKMLFEQSKCSKSEKT